MQGIGYHIIEAMNDQEYMQLALEQARRAESMGEVPIGAVVVYAPIDPATRKPLVEPRVIAQCGECGEPIYEGESAYNFLKWGWVCEHCADMAYTEAV